MLVGVAERIVNVVPSPECLVARLGGDEFAILSRGCEHEGGYLEHAADVVGAFTNPVRAAGEEFTLSTSVGAVGYPLVGTTSGQVMRAADLTLYRAKASGRNRWVAYDQDQSAPQISRHALATDLPGALKRGEFSIRYQPMVSLMTGAVTGVEAVVRWRHPKLGLLTPAQFLPLSVETGFIIELSRWVLWTALDQLRAWRDQHVDDELFLGVNLAPVHLQRPGVAERVMDALNERDLPPRVLQLELTSNALTGDAPGAVQTIRDLARCGIRVAIDDFGTGQANLAYLSRLPLHALKIAGALLEPLSPGPSGQHGHEAVVSAIIGMAHALRLSVTAEAVAHPYQAARLKALGCDMAQGRLFGRPATAEELSARLAAGPTPTTATGPPALRFSYRPAGEQPVDRGVDVEVVGLAAPRDDDVGAAQEAHQDAARHLEQRVAVRRRQRQGDEVAARRGPRPHPDIADARRLVEPRDQQLARERPADRLAARRFRVEQDMHRVRVSRVVPQAGPHRQRGGVRRDEP